MQSRSCRGSTSAATLTRSRARLVGAPRHQAVYGRWRSGQAVKVLARQMRRSPPGTAGFSRRNTSSVPLNQLSAARTSSASCSPPGTVSATRRATTATDGRIRSLSHHSGLSARGESGIDAQRRKRTQFALEGVRLGAFPMRPRAAAVQPLTQSVRLSDSASRVVQAGGERRQAP
jgi:hypothetical protein